MHVQKRIASVLPLLMMVSMMFPAHLASAAMVTQLPVSDGTYRQWAVSTGTQHYQMVDESVCNGTTDYVYTNTTGRRDSFGINLASIPDGSTITSIEITPCASRNRTGGGSSVLNVFYRLNGVNSANIGNYALSGTAPTPLAASGFSSLSIVKGATTVLEAGAILTSGTRGARLSQLSVRITFASPTPPAAPGSFQATNIPGVTLRNDLTWTDLSSNETGFVIERATSTPAGPWIAIGTAPADTTSFSDIGGGLAANQTYYYRVGATNAGGTAYGASDYAITATALPHPPGGPFVVLTATSTIVQISWLDRSLNEEGFKIDRSTDNVNFTEVRMAPLNVTSAIDFGLVSGTTYYYRVRAWNAVGETSSTGTASILIP